MRFFAPLALSSLVYFFFFFFFNDTATTEIYTLSLHDALRSHRITTPTAPRSDHRCWWCTITSDRKSTRLNSSHDQISYAVFCLKKKNRHEPAHSEVAEAWHSCLYSRTAQL